MTTYGISDTGEVRFASFVLRVFVWVIACFLPTVCLQAQLTTEWNAAAETAVIFNPDFPGSAELANYYAKKRHIPKERVIGLRCSQEDSMSRAQFNAELREPLVKTFASRNWRISPGRSSTNLLTGDGIRASAEMSPDVRVLVLIRGVPFQVRRDTQNPKQSEEDEACVDSELTVLGAANPPREGGLHNPYFDQPSRFPHTSQAAGVLIVGRLDGPDDATVRRMIDDALFAEENGLLGRAVVDFAQKSGAYQEGEDWLKRSADMYRLAGIPVFTDRAASVLGEEWPLPDTILYFGWYTDHIAGALASPDFRFKRGAIACHLHSFSASIIRSPDKAWAGPLLANGAAATFGNVFEPYLSRTVHFDILNKRLLEGFTLGEAAWNATPALSWMNVVLGDPLYRPFGKGAGARLGSGSDRDYALYQGMVQRMAADSAAHIKTAIAELAVRRRSSLLLECTALLSAHQQRYVEAADLLEHAESTASEAKDKLRLRLYRAEMLRRAEKAAAARSLLQETLADAAFKDQPARAAAESLLKELGG